MVKLRVVLFLFIATLSICNKYVWCKGFDDSRAFDKYLADHTFEIDFKLFKNNHYLFKSTNESEASDAEDDDDFIDREIDDFFVQHDGSEITLTDLKITGDPSPRLTKSSPNMMYAFLDTAFEWSTVIVDGNFVFYKNPGSLDSEHFGGKIRLMWVNTKADGKIAFRPVDGGDVFLSSNYDLNFTSNSFKILLLNEQRNRKSNQIIYAATTPIRKHIEQDVFRRLRENLRTIVDKTLTSKSMLQMFGGNADMVTKYRSFIQENELLANKVTDDALTLIHKKLKENGQWKLKAPKISRNFTRNFGLLSAAGNVTLKEGTVQNISTIYRNTNFSLTLVDNTTLSGYLTFKDISLYYKQYEASFWNIMPFGEILAKAQDTEVLIKFSGKKNGNGPSGFQLYKYQLRVHVNHVAVETNRVSFLVNWLEPILTTTARSCLKQQVAADIEKSLKPILNTLIYRPPK